MCKGFYIDVEAEIDGYVNGKAYHICEFDKDAAYWCNVDFNIEEIRSLKGATPLDKLVWIVISYNSNGEELDGFPMYLFHVTPEQLSVLLNVPADDIAESIDHLFLIDRLVKYLIDGEVFYAALK